MMQSRYSLILVSLGMLAACAEPAHEVVASGHDSYIVTVKGNASFSSSAPLREQAYADARTYCTRRSLQLKPIGDHETYGGYERSPAFTLEFQCVPPQ